MTKTNKEIRSEFAKEMRDKYNERNEELNRIKKSSYSKGLKEQKRKEIMDNFYAEIDEIKKRPGYEEARKAHLEEIKAKSGIRKAKTVEETTKENVKENLSEEYIDFCSEIIKDSTRSIEYKTVAIKELLKHPNGYSTTKKFPPIK